MKEEDEQKRAIIITEELGKYHNKVNAMIDVAYEGPLNTIIYVRLMQKMCENWIAKQEDMAVTNDEKETISECKELIDNAWRNGVFRIE